MGISFHCENCNKKINAPDGTGGKWGKCPNCNHRCYIPMPKSENEEELKLSPIDTEQETDYDEMMKKTQDLKRDMLREKDEPPETDKKNKANSDQ